MESGEFFYNAWTVGSVCHAKPTRVGVEHFDSGFTIVDKGVDAERDEEFGFGGVDVFVEELFELAVGVFKVVGSKAPEVH